VPSVSRGHADERAFHLLLDALNSAEECRRLAKLSAKPDDRQHFIEMAATWDILAKLRTSDKLAETWALAEAIANGRKS
jgi:hypothetical protein